MALDGETGLLEAVQHQPGQILRGTLLHARGDFLGLQFEQQFAQHLRRPRRHYGRATSATGRSGPWPWRSEEHTSELQSLMRISYAVFCLNKPNQNLILFYT